jgi:hypothetical protein
MAWSSWCLVITQGQADSTARGIPALSTAGLVGSLQRPSRFLSSTNARACLLCATSQVAVAQYLRCFVMFSVQGTGKTRIVTNPLRSQDAEATSAWPRFASSMEARSHRCEPRRRSASIGASKLWCFGASAPEKFSGDDKTHGQLQSGQPRFKTSASL